MRLRPLDFAATLLATMDGSLQLDLEAHLPSADRAERWRREIPRIFAGLHVIASDEFAPAALSVTRCAAGRVIAISAGSHGIERRAHGRDASSELLNVVLQVRGESAYRQGGRRGRLEPGDLVLIDGAQGFELELSDAYSQLVCQLPRQLVARRHDGLRSRIAKRVASHMPEGRLVFDAVRAVAQPLLGLDPVQRAAAFDAIVSVLGVLQAGPTASPDRSRFARAVAEIEAQLGDPDLDATMLAGLQGISRRRLEAVFAAHGTSVQRLIWDRRLQRAAQLLADPVQCKRRSLDIALACGFSSEAHFSRRFQQKFGVGPRAYRRGS